MERAESLQQSTPIKQTGCTKEQLPFKENWNEAHRHGLLVAATDAETLNKKSEFTVFFTTYLELSNYLNSYIQTHQTEGLKFDVQIWEYKEEPRLIKEYSVD